MTDDAIDVEGELKRLGEAAARLALVASQQYKASEPENWELARAGFNKGLLESVVVVRLSPQLCIQVGMESADGSLHIFATLIPKQAGAGAGGATMN